MKKGKRLLAVIMAVCMMIGLVSLGFSAFAAPTLQSMIDAAASGATVVLPYHTRESVVIENKTIFLDLNGKSLEGDFGESTITIKNSTVAIVNGQVYSYFANVSTVDMLRTVGSSAYSKPTINIISGSVYTSGLFVDGMQVRIPTTTQYSMVPISSAVFVNKDAYLTVEKSAFVGFEWGLANGYGSHVTIIDGAFAGFDKGIKHEAEVTYNNTMTSRVSVSDMAEKIVPYGVTLNETEKDVVTSMLGDRVTAYVKNAVTDVDTIYQDGDLTVFAKADLSNIVGDIEYSYKWLPDTATVEGVTKPLQYVSATNEYVAVFEDVTPTTVGNPGSLTTNYRLWLGLNSEENEILTEFVDTVKGAYADLGPLLEELYGDVIEGYSEVIAELSAIYHKMDLIGNDIIIGDKTFDSIPEFKALMKDLFLMGGATMYDYIEVNLDGDHDYYYNEAGISGYFGIAAGQPKLLDMVNALKLKVDALDFNDYASLIYFVYDNYEDVVDILELAETYGEMLVADLSSEMATDIIDALADMGNTEIAGYVADADEYVGYISEANDFISHSLGLGEVINIIDYIDTNRADLEGYVERGLYVIENLDSYFAPAVKDNYLKLYTQAEEVEYEAFTPVETVVSINGTGKVEYVSESDSGETMNGTNAYYYPNTDLTLTAIETEPEIEFLYWVNSDTNRILSTDPSYKISSNIKTKVEAVFNDSRWGYQVAFTGATGDISEVAFYVPTIDTSVYVATEAPYIPRYNFVSWPHTTDDGFGNEVITLADLAAYKSPYAGSLKTSAFDEVSDKYMNAIVPVKIGSLNYIVVPDYSVSGNVHINYLDGSTTKSASFSLYSTASITAAPGNFSYWINPAGEIVSLYRTFEFTAVEDNTYTAVFDAPTIPDAVITITSLYRDAASDKLTFYAERSSLYTVKRSGVILTFDPIIAANNAAFVPGGENVLTGTAKYNTLTGNYSVTKNSYLGEPIYARAYIEIEYGNGQRVILYSNTVSYQD